MQEEISNARTRSSGGEKMRLRMPALALLVICSGCVSGRITSSTPACVENAPLAKTVFFREFKTIPQLSPFADGNYWYMLQDLEWLSADTHTVVIPIGFVTDFASIPRPIWWLLPKWGKYGLPGVLHDYLYWSQHVNRKTADGYLREAMADLKVPMWQKQVIWAAVRAFGGVAWSNNFKARSSGHLACVPEDKFPTQATETWEECQRRLKNSPAQTRPSSIALSHGQ
jgi:hypothetical protein